LLVALVALFALPLLAATPSTLLSKPNVIVYPFTPTGSSIDAEAGSRLATILAEQMSSTGRVKVIPPPPGTSRADYLKVALSNDADYYVTGYITPLGDAVAVVEQVVSTTTGIVVFSQTAQIKTYGDAAGQGADLGNLIAGHFNRNLAGIGTPPPQTSPSPAANSGPQADLGKLLNRRKQPAKATATPAPVAPAAALTNVTPPPAVPGTATNPTAPGSVAVAGTPEPAKVVAAGPVADYAVIPIGGSADAALRDHATQLLLDRVHGERADSVHAACAAHAMRAVFSGTLTVRTDARYGGSDATLDLTASDCSGKPLWHETHSNGGGEGQQVAVDDAVDAAVGAYLSPPKKRGLFSH
jgi:hypothetical protein